MPPRPLTIPFLLLLLSGMFTPPLGAQPTDSLPPAVSPEYYLAEGNAAYERGEIGPAVLAYERGLRLRPGDADLKNNLRFVRREAGIAIPELPGFFLERWWRRAGAALGATTGFVLAQLCWWAAVALALYWWVRRGGMAEARRFALLPAAVGLLLLAAVSFALGRSRNAELARTDEAVLTAPHAELRVAPGPTATREADLSGGLTLRLTDERGDYVKVQLVDGRQGWLPRAALEII